MVPCGDQPRLRRAPQGDPAAAAPAAPLHGQAMNALTQDPSRPSRLVREIQSAWLDGAAPDTEGVLARHPELAENRAALFDLAYEEYCLRSERGEKLDPDAYCARFPLIRSELRVVICTADALQVHG